MSLKRSAIILIIITLLSNILGFSREMVLAYKFGASEITDAFIIAQILPILIFGGFINTLSIGYIPTVTSIKDDRKKNQFTSNLMYTLLLLSLVFIVFYFSFAHVFIDIISPGLNENSKSLAANMSRIMSINILFMAISAVLSGYIQNKEKFAIVSFFNQVVVNFIIVITIYLTPVDNPIYISIGFVISSIVVALSFIIISKKEGMILLRPYNTIKDKSVINAYIIALPVFYASLFGQANAIIDRALASKLSPGVISSLNYANRITLLFVVLFGMTIAVVSFPRLNKYIKNKSYSLLSLLINNLLLIPAIFFLPIISFLCINAYDLVEMIFERGQFTPNDTLITSQSLFYYVFGIIFSIYREILVKILISFEKTKYITVNSIVMLCTNVFLSLILIGPLKHMGLALSWSISSFISSVFLFLALRKVYFNNQFSYLLVEFLKILIATFITIPVSFLLNSYIQMNISSVLEINTLIELTIKIGLVLILYIFLLYLLKVNLIKDHLKIRNFRR